MTNQVDVHNPSFFLLPINNNRTAWRPVSTPMILIVPHRRSMAGAAIDSSDVLNPRIYIENVPQAARVAGQDHVGLRSPDRELYSRSITTLELSAKQLVLNELTFTDGVNDIDLADTHNGNFIKYTTSTGVSGQIPFLTGADYYDLSDIELEVETLPSDLYNLIYQVEYYKRITTNDSRNDFICIDNSVVALALFKFQIDHPGKVIDEFYRLTPPPYLTDQTKANDSTVALYRPFTDIMHDVMDEQDLLERINWVFDAPAEAIPYLSQLLGWDLPYFPESLDKLRRAVLRRTVEFQNLKGSRRAIVNIFKLFGFEILISNLWWSTDGKQLIRPDQHLSLEYQNQTITTTSHSQIDIILDEWSNNGFHIFNVPLLFKPQEKFGLDTFTALHDSGSITLDAYLVEDNSQAHLILKNITTAIKSDPPGYGDTSGCTINNSYTYPTGIYNTLLNQSVIGHSQLLLSSDGTAAAITNTGDTLPLVIVNASFNHELNQLNFTLNGYQNLASDSYRGFAATSVKHLYVFATYTRYDFTVPDVLTNLQSNRFDIQILTRDLAESIDPITLDSVIEFLFRLKAFHSQLNVIRTRAELTETYEVTSICFGGDVEQRYDIALGRLQVPPAIIPNVPSDINVCSQLDPANLGYKQNDINFRLRISSTLAEEHAAWKALDGRLATASNKLLISPTEPAQDRTECQYTYVGQDRTIAVNQTDTAVNFPGFFGLPFGFAPIGVYIPILSNSFRLPFGEIEGFASTDDSITIDKAVCQLDGITDYCYKGRVGNELLIRQAIMASESFIPHACSISMGTGVYWTYPARSTIVTPGVRKRASRSSSGLLSFSGKASDTNQQQFLNGIQASYLTADYNAPLNQTQNSFLGKLYRAYGVPTTETLHFSNRKNGLSADQRYLLALQRPEINIDKPTMHLPGCRFPRMNALTDDFVSADWRARPWDMNVVCDSDLNFLNAKLITNNDGSEYLSFDDAPFTLVGNGLVPDISSFGEHIILSSEFVAGDVIHRVFMAGADDNPAVKLDSVDSYDDSVNTTMEIDTPLFSSYNQCGTSLIDFIDGYPSLSGYVPFTETFTDEAVTDAPVEVLFLLNSGIRVERGLRFDCGCTVVDCGTRTGTSDIQRQSICAINTYVDQNGEYDFNADHLQVQLALINQEAIGVSDLLLNGTIPSMMELLA